LVGQPDTSVTIVIVGFLTSLAGLLNSQGEEVSLLDGRKDDHNGQPAYLVEKMPVEQVTTILKNLMHYQKK